MKKIILISTILLCAVSCSSRKNISETDSIPDSPKSYTAEKLSGIAYRKDSVKLPDGLNQIYCFNPYNSGNDCFILGAGATVPENRHSAQQKAFQFGQYAELSEKIVFLCC